MKMAIKSLQYKDPDCGAVESNYDFYNYCIIIHKYKKVPYYLTYICNILVLKPAILSTP